MSSKSKKRLLATTLSASAGILTLWFLTTDHRLALKLTAIGLMLFIIVASSLVNKQFKG